MNPCTLVPTDFQLRRKMKFKLSFEYHKIIFQFSPLPRRKRNSNSLEALLFSIALKKTDFNFLIRFSFSYGFGKRITSRFLFLVYGIETDNLYFGGTDYSQNTQRVPLIIRESLSLIANGSYYSFQTSKFNSNI